MSGSALLNQVLAERPAESFVLAKKKLHDADGEMILDFSHVPCIDVEAVRVLLDLAGVAEAKKVKLILRGVNVDVYKVLKLMKLASRFSYLD